VLDIGVVADDVAIEAGPDALAIFRGDAGGAVGGEVVLAVEEPNRVADGLGVAGVADGLPIGRDEAVLVGGRDGRRPETRRLVGGHAGVVQIVAEILMEEHGPVVAGKQRRIERPGNALALLDQVLMGVDEGGSLDEAEDVVVHGWRPRCETFPKRRAAAPMAPPRKRAIRARC